MNNTQGFDEVLTTSTGDQWFEIKSDEAAYTAGHLSRTAIGTFYDMEAKHEEGRHPRRWFILVGKNENGQDIAKVSLCVLPDGVELIARDLVADCHTTGYMNRPVYPDFEEEIEALSNAIEIDLPPNWQGQPIVVQAVPPSPSP